MASRACPTSVEVHREYPTMRLIYAPFSRDIRTRRCLSSQTRQQPDSRDLKLLNPGMFSAPPDAVSCTHRCHRLRKTSFSFYSTSADSFSLHIQPAEPPNLQPNSSDLPLAILGPVARTDLPQLGPSLLPEPPHSSSRRTPLPSASMASHMHHISTITPGPIFVRRGFHTCCVLTTTVTDILVHHRFP